MLFFNASPHLLPSGATNFWPLQTGSMRVSGPEQQKSTCCQFLPLLISYFSTSNCVCPPVSVSAVENPCPRPHLQHTPPQCTRPSPPPPHPAPSAAVCQAANTCVPCSHNIPPMRPPSAKPLLSVLLSLCRHTLWPPCLSGVTIIRSPLLDPTVMSPPVGVCALRVGEGGGVSVTSETRSRDKNKILHIHQVGLEACLLSGVAFQCQCKNATAYAMAQSVYVDLVFAHFYRENLMSWLSGFQLTGRELNED